MTLAGVLHKSMGIMRYISIFLLLAIFWLGGNSAHAQSAGTSKVEGRYASIIVDLNNQEIVHARLIDEARYPASLTKIMTLYLTFEALDRGYLRIDQALPVSAYAASQPPSKLGLKKGQTILVRDAINAMIVRSANDVAIVLAEAISGSEAQFARLMTQRAGDLGMRRTVFKNPHGLPNSEHISTARDIAKLADRMIRDHRTYYPLFSQKSFTYRGVTTNNTNSLLDDMNGVDRLKTGYTRASGYNLAISAERQGRRLVAIVMGGASSKSRNQHMRELVERGFEVIHKRNTPKPQPIIVKREPIVQPKPVQNAGTTILKLRGSQGQVQNIVHGRSSVKLPAQSSWSLHFGEFVSPRAAQNYLLNIITHRPALAQHIHIFERHQHFNAQLKGLTHQQARPLCEEVKKQGAPCLMVQQTVG